MERLMAQSTQTDTQIEIPTETSSENSAPGADWLSPLEEKVRAAAERIQGLKEENATLHRRIETLEEQLAVASSAPPPAVDDGTARWEEERRAIRERVERLTRTLEEIAGV
jgi:predicted RNase H-like nuclease (RuvC/YqgF family)